MSGEKLDEGVSLQPEPTLPASLEGVEKTQRSGPKVTSFHPSRISLEHNYAKLVPFRSSLNVGSKDSSFSTVVLFADKVSSKPKRKSLKQGTKEKRSKVGKVRSAHVGGVEEVLSSNERGDEVVTEEGESSAVPILVEVEPRSEKMVLIW